MLKQFRALGRSYRYEKSLETNISDGYLDDDGSRWEHWEAFRESVQNMMDEAEKQANAHGGEIADYCGIGKARQRGKAWIRMGDKGSGVDLERIFLIGESGKRGTQYRGQKGEGEVLSFLVCARLRIEKWMFSQDWALRGRFDNYNGSGYQVLTMDVYRSDKPIEGTEWRFESVPEMSSYVDDIYSYFPDLSRKARRQKDAEARQWAKEQQKRRRLQQRQQKREVRAKSTGSTKKIMTPKKGKSARLYVRGIFVKEIEALFSYNLTTVAINRDRSMVDDFELLDGMQEAFSSDDMSYAQRRRYWENAELGTPNKGCLEYRKVITIEPEYQAVMAKAFQAVFGRRSCVRTDRFAASDAVAMGYRVVELDTLVKDTAIACGVRTDRQVAGYIGDIRPMKQVGAKIRGQIAVLQQIAEELELPIYEVIPVLRIVGVRDDSVVGIFNDGKVYILKKMFDRGGFGLLRVYLHETGHGDSGYGDGHREFTRWFEKMLVKALTGHWSEAVPELIQRLCGLSEPGTVPTSE